MPGETTKVWLRNTDKENTQTATLPPRQLKPSKKGRTFGWVGDFSKRTLYPSGDGRYAGKQIWATSLNYGA